MKVPPSSGYMYPSGDPAPAAEIGQRHQAPHGAVRGSPSPTSPTGATPTPYLPSSADPFRCQAVKPVPDSSLRNQRWEGGRDVLWSTNLEKKG